MPYIAFKSSYSPLLSEVLYSKCLTTVLGMDLASNWPQRSVVKGVASKNMYKST